MIFEQIYELNKDTELWWDSSPLVYEKWLEDFDKKNKTEKLNVVIKEAEKLYSKSNPTESLLRGVTTNPSLSLSAANSNREYWEKWLKELKSKRGKDNSRQVFWEFNVEIIKRGAEMFQQIFEKSKYRYGYICGQVDPRFLTDTWEMVKQGILLKQAIPNVSVKMPGTNEGIYGIMILTSLGIPTTATVTFVVPQFIAVAEAVKKGLEIARENKVDLSRWRSTIAVMLGRFEDSPEFAKQAKQTGIELSETDKRLAGIAVFKKAYKIFRERKYESKLLAASMRVGPVVDGKMKIWHIEKLIGADAVLAIFPNIFESFIINYQNENFKLAIDEPVSEEVIKKLLKIPYFRQGYVADGLKQQEFEKYPPVIETGADFQKSIDNLEKLSKGWG